MRTICLTSLLVTLVIASCDERTMNQNEIRIKGCIIDSATKMPIAYAKITLVCWYHAGWDKADYISIDTLADQNGCYKAKFSKGYKIIIASVAENYNPNLKMSEELESNNIDVVLKLQKRRDTTDLTKSINLRYYIIQNSNN